MAPFWKLCNEGNLDEVRSALARGDDENDKGPGGTALMYAVYNGHHSIVKLLLDQLKMKINEKSVFGDTALHRAVRGNHPECARMLLLHPNMDSANSTNDYGETAVMMAVNRGHMEVLRELVKHRNVNLDIKNANGNAR